MCGRYYRRSDKQKIAEAFHVHGSLTDIFVPDWDYNVAPYTFQPVIRTNHETGEREFAPLMWGLIPFGTQDISAFKKKYSTINARDDKLNESSWWQKPLQHGRCLVPADGFYEWLRPDPKTKIPYRFTVNGGETFAFAGLWDRCQDATGGWLESFTIITTSANHIMRPVHTRMPVILHPEDYDNWMKGSMPPMGLVRPYESTAMQSYLANPLVGNVRNNGPEMLNSA